MCLSSCMKSKEFGTGGMGMVGEEYRMLTSLDIICGAYCHFPHVLHPNGRCN